jgi:hypothetical protein
MVKEALVGLDVERRNQVLGLLDTGKFPVPVALWIRRGEEGDWRLMLASPLYDRLGPGTAYRKLIDTLGTSDQDWVRSPIQLESTKNPWVRGLRGIFGKAANATGMRLGGQTIGGIWLDDAYVYRIQ